MTSEPNPNLPARADSGVRQAETETYTQTARGRLTALPFGLGFIALGVLLLIEDQVTGLDMTPPIIGLMMGASLVLTFLFRFFASGRQERGLLFLAVSLLSLGGLGAAFSVAPDTFDLAEWYPLALVGVALALFLTYAFERQAERGLLGVGALFLVMASAAFLVTFEVIPQNVLDQIADYWPLLIALLGITLVPVALRRSAE